MTKQPVYNLLSNEIKNFDKDSKLILEDLKLSVLRLKNIVSKKKEYYNSWQYQIDLCKEILNDFIKNPISIFDSSSIVVLPLIYIGIYSARHLLNQLSKTE
tara:strand:+ start:1790 stop:2092 length:303 start_codon:yes stop_codon:yes gene_type:complete